MAKLCSAPLKDPFGALTVALAMTAGDVLQLDAHRGDLHRIDLDAHGRLLLPADGHLGDAGNARNLLREDVSAKSSTVVTGSTAELTEYIRIGESEGLTFLKFGGAGRFFGSWPPAA